MKSLFFVSSPMEMISAIEARNFYGLKDSELVLYLIEVDKPIIDFLLEKSPPWNKIYYKNRSNYYGFSWVLFIKKLKKQAYEYLFTAGQSFCSHFIFNLKYQKHYFLDDGTLSINLVNYFKKYGNLSEPVSLFSGRKKEGVKYQIIENAHLLFNHKLGGIWNKVAFFTMFDFEKTKNLELVKNSLVWFQSITSDNKITEQKEAVYIVGTVTEKIVDRSYYHKVLERMLKFYPNHPLIYIPHRRETEEEINEIRKIFPFLIQKNQYLIEIDFLINGIKPKTIAGTFSTAFFTLKKLYPQVKIHAFVFDLEKVNGDIRDRIKELYQYQNKYVEEIG